MNFMRGIALGRKHSLAHGQQGSPAPKSRHFSIVESCRKLGVPMRKVLADVLRGMANRSIQPLADRTPAAYAARMAKLPPPAWTNPSTMTFPAWIRCTLPKWRPSSRTF